MIKRRKRQVVVAPPGALASPGEVPPIPGAHPWEDPALAEKQWQRLVYELNVHQVELEAQNEELRAARLELEVGLDRASALFDFAPIGYALLAADGCIREVNHLGARLMGDDRAALTGKTFRSFLASDDRPEFESLLARALDSQGEASCEVATWSGSGAGHLRLKASTLGRPERMVLLAFEDITVERAREEKLRVTERALREADRHKNDFLSALSHELRNPLSPIQTGLALLERVEPGSERGRHAQEVVRRQLSHLTRLVDDLLDVTRISRGKIRLERAVVELAELVQRTVDDHRETFHAHGIELTAQLEPGLCWVDADPTRLVQSVSNVLANASKFTDSGGRVTVELRRDGGSAVLTVIDSGIGIDPGMIAQVFQPFVQAPQTIDRTRGGLGLGLPMTRGLIELHGGVVQIASPGVGEGTAVTIILPLVPAPAEVELEEPAARDAPSARRRVLVIDDNVDSVEVLQYALAEAGHTVQVAYDGWSGVAAAHRGCPEVIVCDIGLPGMNGYEVARTLRSEEAFRGVFLVALSGYGAEEDRQRAFEAGFDRHITKPPNLDELEQLIAADHPLG